MIRRVCSPMFVSLFVNILGPNISKAVGNRCSVLMDGPPIGNHI